MEDRERQRDMHERPSAASSPLHALPEAVPLPCLCSRSDGSLGEEEGCITGCEDGREGGVEGREDGEEEDDEGENALVPAELGDRHAED